MCSHACCPCREQNGLVLEERVAMPANNQTLVFRKVSAQPTPAHSGGH
jgi:hypothetical protein